MAPLNSVKLVYFNGRGRAETCRWVLHQACVEFEDYRMKEGEWPTIKPTSPNGMSPFVEIDGKKLGSSTAIAAYVARCYDMMGADDWQAAEIQMIVDMISDTVNAAVKIMFCKDETEKEELKKTYKEKTIPGLLSILEKRLEGGKQWLVGDKMSLADIGFAQFMHDNKEHMAVVEENQTIKDLIHRVTELPNIKKWIAERPETPF